MKEQCVAKNIAHKNNSRILRKMPAPATPHSNTSFSPYHSNSNTAFRSPSVRPPVVSPPRTQPSYSPSEHRNIYCYEGEKGDIGAKRWAKKQVESFKAAYDVGKPVLESSVMIMLSLLFLMFFVQLLIQAASSGKIFWKRSD